MLFYLCCAIIAGVCGYLTVAQCYRTGVLGCVGFGLAAGGAAVIVGEAWAGTQYQVATETQCIIIGLALYLIQTAWRARYHGVQARNRRASDRAAERQANQAAA